MNTIEAQRNRLPERTVSQPSRFSTKYLLTPRSLEEAVEIAIPVATMNEDTEVFLREAAIDAYTDQFINRPEFGKKPTKTARLKLIKETFNYRHNRQDDDVRYANMLGITANQVTRKDLRGRRKKEVKRFQDRLNGLFTISSILEGNVDKIIDRRVTLSTPNGKLSDVCLRDALKGGFVFIGVAIALEAARVSEQTTAGINGELSKL